MAQVILLSTTPAEDQTDYNLSPVRDLRQSAQADRFKIHSVTGDPYIADIILFAEFYGAGWYFERIRRHAFVRQWREKCFLFCSNAFVIPFLPGVYASVEKRWASARTRPGFYVGLPKDEFATFTAPTHDLPYLFSFMGSTRNAGVRRDLATLSHARGFFQNTAEDYDRARHGKMDPDEKRDYHRRYAELTKATKFVLCPRGLGASTIRLFETLRMGRVPVILSDEWVEPVGPCWHKCAIRIRERDFAQVPRILEERESEAVEMGQLARREWEEWFSEEVVFHRAVELCIEIAKERRVPESLARWPVYLQYLRPFHLRHALGEKYRTLRQAPAGAAGQHSAATEQPSPRR
ncbi:MAG: hypothetical protein QOE34_625 [Verrucomicrobiota bacterium]|jgi:hypothetical protein